MKKIFSTVAMAMVAFVSVVSMASCSNDSPSSFNAAPQVPETTQTQVTNNQKEGTEGYSYFANIPNDVLSLYDVTFVRTIGDKTTQYEVKDSSYVANSKFVGPDKFKADRGVNVSVKATFTLKADFQQFLDKVVAEQGADAKVDFSVVPLYDFSVIGSNEHKISGTATVHKLMVSKLDAKALNTLAGYMSDALSVDNQK